MNFAIISTALDCLGMAHRLKNEGHKVFINYKEKSETGSGFGFEFDYGSVESFVSKHKKDIILFEDSSKGILQGKLRKLGFKVIGSSAWGEKIEKDRMFGIEFAKSLGINVPQSFDVKSTKEAIKFIKDNPKQYILKQEGDMVKSLSNKSDFDDSRDLIDDLEQLEKTDPKLASKMVLQEVIDGTEVACGAWFNKDWIKQGGTLLELNFENKPLLQDNRGISTGEMGTGFYFTNKVNRIFTEMLEPLTETLKKEDYIGCIDSNCMYSNNKLYLLEWTARFGYPISDGYIELLNTDLGEFFNNMIEGKEVDFNLKDKGMVLSVPFPLFPYEKASGKVESFKHKAIWLDELNDEEINKVHFAGLMKDDKIRIANDYGFALTVTGSGKTFEDANKEAWDIVEKIKPSKKSYARSDLGKCVEERYNKVKSIL